MCENRGSCCSQAGSAPCQSLLGANKERESCSRKSPDPPGLLRQDAAPDVTAGRDVGDAFIVLFLFLFVSVPRMSLTVDVMSSQRR